MTAIRIRFKKEGRAKYISHLDLNRCMQRALRRAKIPVWRTQGFNPHPYIVFALPLSLFYESECEVMDAKLDTEMPFNEVKQRLSEQMPEGITVIKVAEPKKKIVEIGFASFAIELDFYNREEKELSQMVEKLLLLDEIVIKKTTKRSEYDVNIKDIISFAQFKISKGCIKISATLPQGTEKSLNPSCITDAFTKYACEPDFEYVKRLEIFDKSMNEFE